MTREEFNKKWGHRLEKGFETQGCMIIDEDEIGNIDKMFEQHRLDFPHFTFSQIKKKFGETVIYTTENFYTK